MSFLAQKKHFLTELSEIMAQTGHSILYIAKWLTNNAHISVQLIHVVRQTSCNGPNYPLLISFKSIACERQQNVLNLSKLYVDGCVFITEREFQFFEGGHTGEQGQFPVI